MRKQAIGFMLAILLIASSGAAQDHQVSTGFLCTPTPEDELGPLYQPEAAVRNIIGTGYLLFGHVRSARDCSVIPQARIEIWLAGPDGVYGDDWRATLFSSDNGSYYVQSHRPPGYGAGRPHIHIKVSATNFVTLVTQHYPAEDTGEALLDLVLVPTEGPNQRAISAITSCSPVVARARAPMLSLSGVSLSVW
jgi:protocatechuate 3,4-dioxygenase beta subunit